MAEETSDPLFLRPIVPVANLEDAEHTASAAFPRIAAAGGRATVVHVVEKAGGAPDKASVEQRENLSEDIFDLMRDRAAEAGVEIETELLYGTDVAATIIDAAREADATAIAFTPRGGRTWWDLFSGGVRDSLVSESDRPVVVLPDPAEDETADGGDAA